MITLKEAIDLTNIMDDEVVCLMSYPVGTASRKLLATGREIKEYIDAENVTVHWISPWFSGGEYNGFMFAVSGIEIKDYSIDTL